MATKLATPMGKEVAKVAAKLALPKEKAFVDPDVCLQKEDAEVAVKLATRMEKALADQAACVKKEVAEVISYLEWGLVEILVLDASVALGSHSRAFPVPFVLCLRVLLQALWHQCKGRRSRGHGTATPPAVPLLLEARIALLARLASLWASLQRMLGDLLERKARKEAEKLGGSSREPDLDSKV